jgi:hypothetical protein
MALKITSIAINGSDFSQTNTCGTTLAPGKSCIITVSWSDATSTGILEVNDNAPGSP